MFKVALAVLVCFTCALFALPYDGASPFPNPQDNAGGFSSPNVSQANAQAIYWINLIDQHQYWASWLAAGGLLQDVVTQKQWNAAMSTLRTPLGPVTSRKLVYSQATRELRHGTLGNFMVLQFNTNYVRMTNAVETVVLTTEGPLALWRVISYNIAK